MKRDELKKAIDYYRAKVKEEMAGENLREGNMEVAFELWIERKSDR